MAFPAGLTLVTVHGAFDLPPAGGAAGVVRFASPVALRGASDNAIVAPFQLAAVLDADGEFEIQLPATNDPDWSPVDWTYAVTAAIGAQTITGTLQLDHATPAVELADLLQINGAATSGTTYATLAQLTAAVDAAEAASLPLTGGTVSGDLAVDGAVLRVDGAAGTFRQIQWCTGGVPRWSIHINNTAEAGGSSGSDLRIVRHGDDGEALDAPIGIARATGAVTVGGAVAVGTTATVTGRLTTAERLAMAGFLAPFGARTKQPGFRTNASFLELFAAGHGWGGAGGSTSSDDTTVYYRGSQSRKVVTGGTGVQSFVSKSGLSAMDLTGKALRIVMKVEDVSRLRTSQAIQLRIASDSGFVNGFVFDLYSHNGATNSHMQSNQWHVFTVPWTVVSSATGTYSLTNGVPNSRTGFTTIRLSVFDNSAGAATYWVDSIEVIPDPLTTLFPTGVISLTFDDSWASPYTLGKPKMDSLGYRGTFYNIVQNVGTSQYMTLDQLKQLRDLGHEIGGHAYLSANHNAALGFASLTADEVDYDFVRQKLWLQQNGFTSENFAYPKGQFQSTTDGVLVAEIAKRYWQTSRTISGGSYETLHPGEPQKVRAISAINDGSGLGGRTVASLTAAGGELDRIAGSAGWGIWTFHEITAGVAASSAQVSQAGFNTLMDAIAGKGIAVRPVSEVLDYYAAES